MDNAQNNIGVVQLTNEVISTIAGIAATQIEGIVGMSGGVVDGITKLLTGTQMTKGVKVQLGETEVIVDLSIIVEYGFSIPELARRVQENVRRAIESMTGLRVVDVNIYIQGVHKEIKEKKDKEEKKQLH